MGVRDRLDRIAAWFGFGVDEDDYYEDEEEEDRRHVNDAYANGSRAGGEPGPTVRRLGRSERSSAFGTSLGDLFGSEGPRRRPDRYARRDQPAPLRPAPRPRPPAPPSPPPSAARARAAAPTATPARTSRPTCVPCPTSGLPA